MNISYQKNNKNISLEIFLLYIFLISMYFDMSETGVYNSKIFIIICMFILFIIKNPVIYFERNLVLYYIFAVFICLSGIYGRNNSTALGNIITIICAICLMIIISNTIKTNKQINNIMNFIIILSVILSVRVIAVTDFKRMMMGTYYPDVILQKFIGNRNIIAIMIGIGLNFCIYNIYSYKKYKYYILSIFMIAAILFTGSRKGIIIMIVPFGAFCLFKMIINGNIFEKIKFFIIIILCSIALINLTFKVDFIYKTIGFRIEAIYKEILYKEDSKEGSFNIRKDMIDRGIEYFKEKPLLGHGVSNYRYLYNLDMGKETYSHNNYIELLVNNGVIGFLTYYSFFFIVILRAICKYRVSDLNWEQNYYLFNICMLICMFILDFGSISYNSYIVYIILGLSMKKRYC